MLAALAAVAGVSFATNADAQPTLAEVCQDAAMPTRAEYEANATAYADNFCVLATYAPHRAARQFDSMVSLVRAHNNPNRHYWDRRVEPTAEYLQLLRPWMADRNWGVRRSTAVAEHTLRVGTVIWEGVVIAGFGPAFLWIGREVKSFDQHSRPHEYAVLFMGGEVLSRGIGVAGTGYHPIIGGSALFALTTRADSQENINFMSSDVYWHWINERQDEVLGRD